MIFLSLCFLIGVSGQATNLHFFDWFQGEWTVQRSTVLLKTSEQFLEETIGYYRVVKENGTDLILSGRYYDNDTIETTNHLEFLIEFETNDKGVFKFRPAEANDLGDSELDDKPYHTLFNFDFTELNNAFYYSAGVWSWTHYPHRPTLEKDNSHKGDGLYQFWAIGTDRFTISIQPQLPGKDFETLLYVGKKVPVLVEKSFFQKYGTFLLIGVIFVVQFVMQRNSNPAPPPHPTPQPVQGAGTQQAKKSAITAAKSTSSNKSTAASSSPSKGKDVDKKSKEIETQKAKQEQAKEKERREKEIEKEKEIAAEKLKEHKREAVREEKEKAKTESVAKKNENVVAAEDEDEEEGEGEENEEEGEEGEEGEGEEEEEEEEEEPVKAKPSTEKRKSKRAD